MRHTSLYIDNIWIPGDDELFESINPATGVCIWQGHAASLEQVDLALKAARRASQTWGQLAVSERYAYLDKFNKVLTEQQVDLAVTLSEDTGKPLWEAKTEITAMINKLQISKQAFAERCRHSSTATGAITAVVRHKPHGVVAVLGPYNFPAHLPNGHIIPALIAGNTVVFKPSELTPLISEKIMQCWQQAGLPTGVINMLQGRGEVGKQLVQHPEVDGIFFTGSFATGMRIQQAALAYPHKIIALEMGGNNPLICVDIGNIDAAVYHTIQSAFITSGQRCTCARRLIVTKSSSTNNSAAFVTKLAQVTKNLQVGAYTEQPEPFMGPVISAAAAAKVYAEYQQLLNNGAKIIAPLQRRAGQSAFLTPGIIDVTKAQNRKDEEIFGPLLQLIWVDDFATAIAEANATNYGLAAGILTDNASLYQEFFAYSRAGIVNWNRPLTGASSAAPFGGIGKSGNHRPSAYYAADYCAYPVASLEEQTLTLPDNSNQWIRM